MNHKSLILIASILLLLAAPAAASAQTTPVPQLAYIKEGNVWLHYGDGVTPDRALTNDAVQAYGSAAFPPYYDIGYEMPTWSPGGKWLAFVGNRQGTRTLYVADVTAPEILIEPVATDVATAHPPAWRDANTLTYAATTNQMQENAIYQDIRAVDVQAPEFQPVTLGTYPFGVGCGGGTNIPSQMLYWRETASLGGNFITFAWSGTLVVHSTNCTGSGVAAFDVNTQTDTIISEELSRAKVSPSRTLLAGILPPTPEGDSRIEIYNLANLGAAPTQIVASDIPGTTAAQLAWDEDTDLYYSLQQFEDTRAADPAIEKHALDVVGSWPLEIDIYFCGLRHYNIATATNARIYTAQAYVFTNIAPLDDNNVLFTQISNSDQWLGALENRASEADLAYNVPRTFIIKVTLDPAGSEIFIEDAGQVAIRPQAE